MYFLAFSIGESCRRRGRPRRKWKQEVGEAMESRQSGEDDIQDSRRLVAENGVGCKTPAVYV